ncbi:MAG: aminomethyl-transferring glycine dehydrogenase [Flavobacteriales bacterium]|nr:aminomethyl-transferring glycine dehydrogenase [Flavobacteriales bacterium]
MNPNDFSARHIGPSDTDTTMMLKEIGVNSLDELIEQSIPKDILMDTPLNIPPALSEAEYLEHFASLTELNKHFKNYIGLGYNPSPMIPVIQRNIFENPTWYTSYTPYQAEISQGRLEALLNFQTMICSLTGMPMANASLLDEGTAAAEAMLMLFHTRTREQKKNGVCKFFVSESAFPQTIDVMQTRAVPQGIELVIGDEFSFTPDSSFFGVLIQYPTALGEVNDYSDFTEKAHAEGLKVVVVADIMSLAILTPPAQWGADVAVGSTQRLGIPMGYGGPAAAYFAMREDYKRDMPGRIIGVSKDKNEHRAVRMALQMREQHIKRERATSNICTSSVLMAIMAGMYGVYNGGEGMKNTAKRIHRIATTLAQEIEKMGFEQKNSFFFDTLLVKTGDITERLREIAETERINFLYVDDDAIGISINEATTLEDMNRILYVISAAKDVYYDSVTPIAEEGSLPEYLLRKDEILPQDVFKKYHSETEMMRYIKKLERKDISLTHSMIPLGSCTMKLNAASQMIQLSYPLWGDIHPFAPDEQTEGYRVVLSRLERFLADITGMAATSLQPLSGASGEYAGLRMIQEYLKDNGEGHRNICLIPESAHGTNPASAAMAGFEIITVASAPNGTIDVEDLRKKAEENKEHLACIMITYPSTYGIFESRIREIVDIIHSCGAQVYMDGANMNAQVGLTSPGYIGADVCHLNLHKTFAMPHGGGGPGVGPICVKSHIAPYLPSNPIIKTGGEKACTALASAPWGSAMLDAISYAYILTLGAKGLKKASQYAILNANYLKSRLEKYFSILYSGESGRTAHELIIDIRPIKEKYGITAGDISKRLMDYGYHAPTVSFPVHETLMVEPTESESKEEMDRFADVMINILKEIEKYDGCDDNPVKNAPHPLYEVSADQWNHSYTRSEAAYPLPWVAENKLFPATARIDDGYGDRNLCVVLEK